MSEASAGPGAPPRVAVEDVPLAGLRPEKRARILEASREAFAAGGYSRTGIAAIAELSGISTRTIYKHFGTKERLFAAVVWESARTVADDVLARIAEARAKASGLSAASPDAPARLESVLLDLARAAASQQIEHPEHFALVRQIRQELAHFPEGVLEQWLDIGPRRVRAAFREALEELERAGLLRLGDAGRATLQFIVLADAEISGVMPGEAGVRGAAVEEALRAAVATFLHGVGIR